MSKKLLEICCYTVESAVLAEKAGGQRIELCDNYYEGGTTPSYAAIKQTIKNVNIPVNVILRPRGGDFLYSNREYETIKEDLLIIKELNANGAVVGFLNDKGDIDTKRTAEIIELAQPMEITFHRAFDMCGNPKAALKQLIDLKVTRVLTSGCKNSAFEGIQLLAELVKLADDKIIIMPGSGINKNNIWEIMTNTNAIEFHSSSKIFRKSEMKYFNNNISMGGIDNKNESQNISVDIENIMSMVKILNEIKP